MGNWGSPSSVLLRRDRRRTSTRNAWTSLAGILWLFPTAGCSSNHLPPYVNEGVVRVSDSDAGTSVASTGATCSTPASGCPCDKEGAVAECGYVLRTVGTQVDCSMGNRTCIGGMWGSCIGDHVTTQSLNPSRIRLLNLATSAVGCPDNPCDPACNRYIDSAPGLDAGAETALDVTDAGLALQPVVSTGGVVCTSFSVTPTVQTITVTAINASDQLPTTNPANLTYTASLVPPACFPGTPPVNWIVDRADLATMSPMGQFLVISAVAGPIHSTGYIGSFPAVPVTANVIVNANSTDAGVPAATAALFASTSSAVDPMVILYPYPVSPTRPTVFPLGLLAPVVQWNTGGSSADAIKISLRYPASSGAQFTWSQITTERTLSLQANPVVASKGPAITIPQNVWWAFENSAKGNDAVIAIQRVVAGSLKAEKTIPIRFANGQLKGTVYYQSYGTNLVKNWTSIYRTSVADRRFGAATLAIKPGATQPVLATSYNSGGGDDANACMVCHTVASNGSRLATMTQNGYNRLLVPLPTGATNAAAVSADAMGSGSTPYGWPAFYPDGTMLFSSSSDYHGDSPGQNSQLYAIVSGSPSVSIGTLVASGHGGLPSGLQAMLPAFSPDGRHISFGVRSAPDPVTEGINAGTHWNAWHDLAVMDFDVGSYSFSNLRRVASAPTAPGGSPFGNPFQSLGNLPIIPDLASKFGGGVAPYSGNLAHQSSMVSNASHQHYFTGASTQLSIGAGDTLITYVYLDTNNPPSEVMLQFNNGSWEHRAYFGANSLPWGSDGTESRHYEGALPTTGQWVRLQVPAADVGLVGSSLNGMAFTLFSGKATWDHSGKVTSGGTETVWVEDSLPSGASPVSDGDSWDWIPHALSVQPYSGNKAHQSATALGREHQHYFYNAWSLLPISTGDKLFTYVYLDSTNPPSEVMLQWNDGGSTDGGWAHRAYWGANLQGWGTDGTVSRHYTGALPAAGQWVRLEVTAADVGLEGRPVNGIAFTLFGGKATWDHSGKVNQGGTETVWVEDAIPAGAAIGSDNGDSWDWVQQSLCAQDSQCSPGVCSTSGPSQGQCICTADSQCSPGICVTSGAKAGQCACSLDSQCSPGACNTTTGQCTSCSSDSQCAPGVCLSGVCKCTQDSQCYPLTTCSNGSCSYSGSSSYAYEPVWSSFLPDGDRVVYELETVYNGRDWGGTRSECDNSNGATCQNTGARGELWIADANGTTAPQRLDAANGKNNGALYLPLLAANAHSAGWEAELNYEPTVNPQQSGGYAWVVFVSRRLYGNIATMNPWWSDPRYQDLYEDPTPKKLWVAAIDLNSSAGADPSYPAFYLPGQELLSGNARGFWVLNQCSNLGSSCDTNEDCCDSSGANAKAACRVVVNPAPPPVVKQCQAISNVCTAMSGKCSLPTDCCGFPQANCTAGICVPPPPVLTFDNASFVRVYQATCSDGKLPIWRYFQWQTITPKDSNIIFYGQSSDKNTPATWASTPLVRLGSVTDLTGIGSYPPNWRGVDVDPILIAAAAFSRTYLRVTMQLVPSTDQTSTPVLINWRQEFDCEDGL